MIFRVQWGQKSPKNVFDHNLPWRNRVTISQPFQMETGIFPPQLSPEEKTSPQAKRHELSFQVTF